MEEAKQTNFRVTPEAADKFRDYCKENGLNQAQGLAHIMQIIELNKAKDQLVNRETEIEEFERHIKALMAAYLNSLELAESADERMHDKYEMDLKSKDKTIQDLQAEKENLEAQIKVVRDLREAAESKAREAKEKMETALQQKGAAEQAAMDKDNLNQMLQSRLAEVDEKAKKYDALQAETNELRAQVSDLQRKAENDAREAEIRQDKAVQAAKDEKDAEILALEKENASLNSRLEQEKASTDSKIAAAKLEGEQKVSALEKDHKEELKKLYELISSLQEKNMELMLGQAKGK